MRPPGVPDRVLDDLGVYEAHPEDHDIPAGLDTIHAVMGKGLFGSQSRPHIRHAPIGGLDGNMVFEWECTCGAVYKRSERHRRCS